jgi:tetratricopeptide (TPR) repeat protein
MIGRKPAGRGCAAPKPTLLGLAVAVALAFGGAAARAQEDAAKQARNHLKSGDKHRDKGDKFREKGDEEKAIGEFELALADYQAAYDLVASPKLFYPIAQIEERMGMDLEALGHYRKVLDEADDLPDDLRAEIEGAVDSLRQRLAMVTFAVEPAGATIEVEGKLLGEAPLEQPVPFIPGPISYKVSKEGYKDFAESLDLEPGARTVEVFLEKKVTTVVKDVEPPPPPPPPDPKPTAPARERQRLLIGAGVTGGLATGALVFGIAAQRKHNRFQDETLSQSARDKARDKGKTYALLTDILWVGAAAAGGYTAYYYYTTYKPNRERDARRAAEEAARATWLVPYAGAGEVGLAVGGSF